MFALRSWLPPSMVLSFNVPQDIVLAYRVCEFISTCRQLLPFIEENLHTTGGEGTLPPSVISFISQRLSISAGIVSELWSTHRDVVSSKDIGHFDHLGSRIDSNSGDISLLQSLNLRELLSLSLPHTYDRCSCQYFIPSAAVSLPLPFTVCPDIGCGRKLIHKPPINGLLYTISRGVIPVLCPSLYCNGAYLIRLTRLRA